MVIIIGKHMEMLCFKCHQNPTKKKNMTFFESKGWRGAQFQKFEKKAPHRTVVRTHSQNISTLTQLKNV